MLNEMKHLSLEVKEILHCVQNDRVHLKDILFYFVILSATKDLACEYKEILRYRSE